MPKSRSQTSSMTSKKTANTAPGMPAGKGETADAGGESSEKNGVTRTSFRPPWVKEGPNPLPVPTMPWTLNKRNSLKEVGEDSRKLVVPQLRKVQKPDPQENGTSKKETFVKPQLRPVPPKEPTKLQSKEVKVPIKLNSVKDRELPPMPSKRDSLKDETLESIDKAMPATRNALVREESMKRLSIPNAPPMPPPAPSMPKLIETDLSDKQKERLDSLRSRPKTRPDWTEMLKEVEGGKKLKHVQCNDRSEPLLPKVKAKGQFLYESEKQNAHNELLKEIQTGFKLKKVKTNDRSKPMLEGLRKFRRQMTIEEQIQKSQSMASIPPEEIITDEADEMDDIDKVRDDLQSTKQLLAFELRNKEAQIRENKRLQARIQNLEAEIDKFKAHENEETTAKGSSEADEKIIKNLKSEAEEARKTSEELEKKYTQAAEELDAKKSEIEEVKRQNRELEKKLQETLQGKRQSISADRKMSTANQESEEEEEFEVSESESDGSDNEEKRERRVQREVKMCRNKLKSFKNKEDNAKKERLALKEQMKRHQQAIKEEKKKYKALQKEVNKMASLMKDSSEDEEEEEEEEEEEKEESESETESSESETESSESETESEKSQSEAEDAPVEKIKTNLSQRTKRHENLLGALKKGNYLLKTNVELLQDDLNKQKELTVALQEDLDSVLAELG